MRFSSTCTYIMILRRGACYVASLRRNRRGNLGRLCARDSPRRRDRSSTLPDLLSSLSQSVTLPFQSQVCLSKSKASPLGHVICFRPDLVHLSAGEPVDRKTKGVCVSLTRERDAMFAYSRARRSSSRSSSSRRSAARCRTRGRSGSAPSPAWSRRSRSLCRTWDIYIIPHMEKCTCLSLSLGAHTRRSGEASSVFFSATDRNTQWRKTTMSCV